MVDAYEEIAFDADSAQGLNSALRTLVQRNLTQAEVIAAAMPSASALSAVVQLPFDDPKVIEQVLASQLSGKLPVGDEHVTDFTVLRAHDTESFDVLVLAYPKDILGARLQELGDAGVDPQIATVLPFTQHCAARFLHPGEGGVYGVLDIGRQQSVLTLMHGERFLSSRSLLVGGANIDQALVDAIPLDAHAATNFKHDFGFVAPRGLENTWFQQLAERGAFDAELPCDAERIAKACRDGLLPLLLALRQSLTALSVEHQVACDFIELAGGGARLRSLAPYLAHTLGIDVKAMRFEGPAFTTVSPNPLALPEIFAPLSLALAAAGSHDNGLSLNLRKGSFAFKGVFEFIKERAISFALLAALLLFSLVFMLAMQYRAVAHERELLKASLAEASSKVFGVEVLSKEAVNAEFEKAQAYTFIPERTAFDHFTWISNALTQALPEADFEFENMEINTQRKVVTIKANTASDEVIPQVMDVLEGYECFPKIIPEPKTQKLRGRVIFDLRIEADRCYANSEEE
jgi:general secretion pathway protein L